MAGAEMKVREIMHSITVVKPDTSVREVAELMRKKKIGSVLVELAPLRYGILTERDILTKVVAEDADPAQVKASEVMTELRYTIDAEASVEKASEIIDANNIRRLPVMQNGEIVGMVTARDVARACIRLAR